MSTKETLIDVNSELAEQRKIWWTAVLKSYKVSLGYVGLAWVCACAIIFVLAQSYITAENISGLLLFYACMAVCSPLIALPHALIQHPPYPSEQHLIKVRALKALYEEMGTPPR